MKDASYEAEYHGDAVAEAAEAYPVVNSENARMVHYDAVIVVEAWADATFEAEVVVETKAA